jgi:hypothetical protein
MGKGKQEKADTRWTWIWSSGFHGIAENNA